MYVRGNIFRWDEIQFCGLCEWGGKKAFFVLNSNQVFCICVYLIFKCQSEMKAKKGKIRIQWNHCPWNTFYKKNLEVWPNEIQSIDEERKRGKLEFFSSSEWEIRPTFFFVFFLSLKLNAISTHFAVHVTQIPWGILFVYSGEKKFKLLLCYVIHI